MNMPESFNGFAGEDWVRRERVVRQFEEAWRRQPRPTLDAFLNGAPGCHDLLVELVHVDLEFRHRAGEPVRVEEYLHRYPELAENRSDVFGLYEAERDLGRRYGPPGETPASETKHTGSEDRSGAIGTAAAAAPVPARLGKFRLGEELGYGAFGTVYCAEDTELRRPVALKVLHRGVRLLSDRFLREAQSAGQLRHPGIAAVYEAGQDLGFSYLASEYVPGQTLARRLQDGLLPARAAADLLAQVADALDYAHRRGVVHRDVKPSNIQIDPEGQPHLLDFGLARWEAGDGTLTRDGDLLGTPAYMSPEQARGDAHRVDGRSDVYSLGVVLYEALTGQLPFRGDPSSVLRRVLEEEPPPPRRLNRDVPRDLETVCLKAMAKNRADRYATAAALADDLRRFSQGIPVKARPVGLFGRVRRWCRRNPVPAGLGAILTVTLLGVGWQWHRAEGNLAEADRQRLQAVENLQKTHQAVTEFVELSFRLWFDLGPDLDPMRLQLTEKALAYYENFLLQRSEDPSLRVDVAKANLHLAQLHVHSREHWRKALPAARKSLQLWQELTREFPANGEYLKYQALAHATLGRSQLQNDQPREARHSFEQACAQFLAHGQPKDQDAGVELAMSYFHLGNIARDRRNFATALSWHQRAHAEAEQLARRAPTAVAVQDVLAVTKYHLARAQDETGQTAQAFRTYQDSAAVWKRLTEKLPQVQGFQAALGACYHNLGTISADTNQPAEAIRFYRQALQIRERLVRENPTSGKRHSEYGGTWYRLGTVLEKEKNLQAALEAYQNAIAEQRLVSVPTGMADGPRACLSDRYGALARVQRKMGRPAEAVATALERRKLWPHNPKELYRVACELARAIPLAADGPSQVSTADRADRKAIADQAMTVLQQAIREGFTDLSKLQKDPDLDPLRSRDDFKSLLLASAHFSPPP
jgi:serine/threonine-protein kinase